MHARVTRYKMRAGTREDAIAVLEELRHNIMSLPGILQVTTVRNSAREGYVFSVNESEAQMHANAAKVAALWAKFAPYMESMPVSDEFEVLAHWVKPEGPEEG